METLLNENTKIVSFQHVSNVMACINPVKQMVEMVRAKASSDAVIILDACQSLPHMKVDVQSLGVDFLAASGHKMCAPTGIGFLWGREDLLNSMPPYMGGGEMIDRIARNSVNPLRTCFLQCVHHDLRHIFRHVYSLGRLAVRVALRARLQLTRCETIFPSFRTIAVPRCRGSQPWGSRGTDAKR